MTVLSPVDGVDDADGGVPGSATRMSPAAARGFGGSNASAPIAIAIVIAMKRREIPLIVIPFLAHCGESPLWSLRATGSLWMACGVLASAGEGMRT